MTEFLINIGYLIAAVLFILGLKGLTHPRTAVRGNLLGACGMFLAVLITLTNQNIVSFEVILAGVIVGAAIGAALAIKIKMTAMPELVALFNGFGGAASALVAGAALIESTLPHQDPFVQMTIATAASGLIGSVTFWGSLVAFGKLQGLIHENAILFTGQRALNAALGIFALGLSVVDPSPHCGEGQPPWSLRDVLGCPHYLNQPEYREFRGHSGGCDCGGGNWGRSGHKN